MLGSKNVSAKFSRGNTKQKMNKQVKTNKILTDVSRSSLGIFFHSWSKC